MYMKFLCLPCSIRVLPGYNRKNHFVNNLLQPTRGNMFHLGEKNEEMSEIQTLIKGILDLCHKRNRKKDHITKAEGRHGAQFGDNWVLISSRPT